MPTHVDPATRQYHQEQTVFARQAFIDSLTPEASADDWHVALQQAAEAITTCLTATQNLSAIATALTQSGRHLWTLRHMLAPPASQDRFALICPDYKKASENKGRPIALQKAMAIEQSFAIWRNRDLTKWIDESRSANAIDLAAIVTSVAPLMASQLVSTVQRNRLSDGQEMEVVDLLTAKGWTRLPSQLVIATTSLPPRHFMRKTKFATQQRPQEVDIACGFENTVVCAMECKVTNDATNSIKRVNDVLKKAKAWQDHFGSFVRTAALLKGVMKFSDVERLLTSDVRVFWSHDLPRFDAWIDNPV